MGDYYSEQAAMADENEAAAKRRIPPKYERLPACVYILKPAEVYQIPGTRYGVRNDSEQPVVLAPLQFDKVRA